MNDRVVSWLRTVVPGVWAALITWGLSRWDGAPTWLGDFLASEAATAAVVAAVLGAWYGLWRWLEPRIPDWATRLVLGSAKAPSYGG